MLNSTKRPDEPAVTPVDVVGFPAPLLGTSIETAAIFLPSKDGKSIYHIR